MDDYKIKLLHIMLPKKKANGKSYDGETKWIYFRFENDLLKKYVWNKVSDGIEKEFECELVNNKMFSKTKIKSYGDKAKDSDEKNS